MSNAALKNLLQMIEEENDPNVLKQPKYAQLATHLSHMIEAGVWKPGDKLPSEADMAEVLPASLGTIQKALNRLYDQGAIIRKHYRGTFVNGPQSLLGPWHLKFLDDDGKTVLPVHQEVVGVERVEGEEPWVSFLGDSPFYVCIKRAVDVNGEFRAVSHFFVAGEKYGDLLDMPIKELKGTYIRAILRSRFGTPTLRLNEKVACQAFPSEICESLGLPEASVGMVFHIQSYGYRDGAISYHLVYLPPNRRLLELGEKQT